MTLHPVVVRGVDREAAPAAADVEHALAGGECELARDHVELGRLRLLERARAAREDRAAVGHRGVEEQREEVVADVVVVADSGRVALEAVTLAAEQQLQRRPPRDSARQRRHRDAERQSHTVGHRHRRRLPVVDDEKGGVEVVDAQRALDVRAEQPERPRRPQAVRERRGALEEERWRCWHRRGDGAAVPEPHVERALGQGVSDAATQG